MHSSWMLMGQEPAAELGLEEFLAAACRMLLALHEQEHGQLQQQSHPGGQLQRAAGYSAQLQQAVWRLLLAGRPAAAAALHSLHQPLPKQCISFKAFRQAVLGWPVAEAHTGTEHEEQQQQYASRSLPKGACSHCGRQGFTYTASFAGTSPASAGAAASEHPGWVGRSSSGGSTSSRIRTVCAAASCVAAELQALAQLGPPGQLREPRAWASVTKVLLQEMLPGRCDAVAALGGQQEPRQLQLQYVRALQVSLCKVSLYGERESVGD